MREESRPGDLRPREEEAIRPEMSTRESLSSRKTISESPERGKRVVQPGSEYGLEDAAPVLSLLEAGEQGDAVQDSAAAGTPEPEESRYEIKGLHAEGGLGSVFLARDRQLAREVALKTLRTDRCENPELLERFLLEAYVTGGLEHPGVVPVYSVVKRDASRPYYAMQFIRGESLASAIAGLHAGRIAASGREGEYRLAFRKLLARLVTVCRTLAYAHRRGVVHRDIKPENIMLGAYGETLVVDWGLAKLVPAGAASPADRQDASRCDPEDDSTRSLEPLVAPPETPAWETQFGAAVGTLAYMSPEQALGAQDLVGPGSDIYSLGVVLYVLLTGRRPFQDASPAAVRDAIVLGRFPRPRRVAPRVDRALEAICQKAMHSAPAFRYATAAEMADDLEAYLADEPIRAWREPLAYRARRWARRHRSLVFSVGVSLLIICLLLAGGMALLRAAYARERAAKEVAQLQRTEAQQNLKTAMGAVDRFLTRVAEDEQLQRGEHSELRRRLLSDARRFLEQFVAKRPSDTPLLAEWGRAHLRLAELTDALGDTEASEQWCRTGAAVFGDLLRNDPAAEEARLELAKAENRLGILALQRHAHHKAREYFDASIRHYRRLLENYANEATLRAETAGVLQNLAKWELAAGRSEAAEQRYREALAMLEGLENAEAQGDDPVIAAAQIRNNLGILLQSLGHDTQAIGEYRESARLLHGADDRELSVAHHVERARNAANFAALLAGDPSQLEAAESRYDAALDDYRTLTEQYPHVAAYRDEQARTLNNYAALLLGQDRVEEAQAALERAKRQLEALVIETPAGERYQAFRAGVLGNLAALHMQRGDVETAMAEFEEEIAAREQLAERFPHVLKYAEELAFARKRLAFLLQQRDSEAAAALWRRLAEDYRAMAERFRVQREVFLLDAVGAEVVVAAILAETGDAKGAIGVLDRAMRDVDRTAVEIEAKMIDGSATAISAKWRGIHTQVHLVRASAYREMGNYDHALAAAEEASRTAPASLDHAVRGTKIDILLDLGRFDEARAEIDAAQSLADGDPAMLRDLAPRAARADAEATPEGP